MKIELRATGGETRSHTGTFGNAFAVFKDAARLLETRNPEAAQPQQVQRTYTCWIDASNWATATEAAGVCYVGQQDVTPSCCGGGPQWGHAWTCQKCPD